MADAFQRDSNAFHEPATFRVTHDPGYCLSIVRENEPPNPGRAHARTRVEPDPILSFVQTGILEPRPRLLVDRLLFARALLQSNVVLAPRFELGDCAAAHHIVLDGAVTGRAASQRLLVYGFRVEPSTAPPGIRFFLSSSHSEPEIRALLVAITLVVRELQR